mgnify:FL=1
MLLTQPVPTMRRTGNVILVHNPVVWWKPATWLFGIIRLVAGTRWNHCALFAVVEGHPVVIEALGRGVVATAYGDWLRRSPDRVTHVVDVACTAPEIVAFLGKKYDRKSLLWYCLRQRVNGKWKGLSGDAADDALYCFELAALVHGLPEWHRVMPDRFVAHIRAKEAAENARENHKNIT